MSENGEMVKVLKDTVKHKKIVLDNCMLLAEYLIKNNREQLGFELLKRGSEHDLSKFSRNECKSISTFAKSKELFTDPNTQLSEHQRDVLVEHWKVNRHHPEYFNITGDEISELDMIEMVCDWYARSKQYNTEFIPFIVERQRNRFKINSDKFNQILQWALLLKGLDEDAKYKYM